MGGGAGSIAPVLKAQLSRLGQERRHAALTAARRALLQLSYYLHSGLAAFPLTPVAARGKQVCRALRLYCEKNAAAHAPCTDATSADP